MHLSDTDIAKNLDTSLHAQLEPTSLEDVGDVHESPCFSFGCSKLPNIPRSEQLVKSLSWSLESNAVGTGSLLVFSVEESEVPVFLGVAMKKPMLHMFVDARLDDQEASCTDCNGQATFQTSHELFLNLLGAHSADVNAVMEVKVDVWKCRAFFSEDSSGRCSLKNNPFELQCSFIVSSKAATKNKPVTVKLPFQLDSRLKEHRKKTKEQKRKNSAKQKQSKTSRTASMTTADNVGSTSSETDDNGDDPVPDAEEEAALPMSSVVEREQNQLPVLAKEIEEARMERENKSETLRENVASGSYQKTFFSSETGLYKGAFATTGRSICLKCKKKIAKDTIRFSWYHSVLRPTAWVHCHCLYHLVKESDEQLHKHAIDRLKVIVQEAEAKPHVHHPIAKEASNILTLLQQS